MSMTSSPFLAKLQELKLWQGNYDALLQQNRSRDATNPSDLDTIDGLSALDSSRSSREESPSKTPRSIFVDWDKKAIMPPKPFEQLLEEKLAEEQPVEVKTGTKKPFLRKGSGLARYNLTPKHVPAKTILAKNPSTVKKPNLHVKRPVSPTHKDCVKATSSKPSSKHEEQLIPLKMPEAKMKSKATWVKVNDSNSNGRQEKEKSPERQEGVNILAKLNEYGLKQLFLNTPKKKKMSSPENIQSSRPSPEPYDPPSHSVIESVTERELRIFEDLEERVEHNSFSSTNSSVIGMLYSTPNKKKKVEQRIKSPIQEKPASPRYMDEYDELLGKLEIIDKRGHFLNEFINNLKKISDENHTDSHTDKPNKSSLNSSYSESTNTESSHTETPLSFYTDFENTLQGASPKKVNIGVNTSFTGVEESTQIENCLNCEALTETMEKLKKQIPDIQKEKAKLCDFAKDLEKKRDQLTRDLHKLQKKYDEEVGDLMTELENEKKKFQKEKAIFDMYIKESQVRPSKKEREELMMLRKELDELKELLKLKETKNGASQARLRNQVKQLEKDKCELKESMEKLQRENAKLSASQKLRRAPSEVKMLHEINKNLTKLTEETFKRHLVDSKEKIESLTEKETGSKASKTQISPVPRRKSEVLHRKRDDGDCRQSKENTGDITKFIDLSLEKQYEQAFRSNSSPVMQNTLNDSKKEFHFLTNFV
ncbi:unnamed protein product [Acanthoscelides obtectus]|uniref:Uncharacterized protein n=1 Tax=Acanthoscelides obtectus TaxID=200917 RepID=A0A9P0JXB1_ACAOB|nr:unnamed protein product [Acanthoscelides obtectus]CAK1663814.1 Centromere protein J [Acanthoscelides obtectus]